MNATPHNSERPQENPKRERALKTRAFLHKCFIVFLAAIAAFAGIFAGMEWVFLWTGQDPSARGRSFLIALLLTAVAVAFLILTLRELEKRRRWKFEVARYESYDLFVSCLQEANPGTLIEIGKNLVSGLGGPLVDVALLLQDKVEEATLRERFYELQRERDSGRISPQEHRRIIDRFFEEVTKNS